METKTIYETKGTQIEKITLTLELPKDVKNKLNDLRLLQNKGFSELITTALIEWAKSWDHSTCIHEWGRPIISIDKYQCVKCGIWQSGINLNKLEGGKKWG